MTKPLKVRLEEVQLGDSVFHPMKGKVEFRAHSINHECYAVSSCGRDYTFKPHEMRKADGSEAMVHDGKLFWVIVEPGELYSVRLEDVHRNELVNVNSYLTPLSVALGQISVTEEGFYEVVIPYGKTYTFMPHEAEGEDGSQLLLCDDGALRWIVIEPAKEDDAPEMLFDEDGNQCMGMFIGGELKRAGQ